MNARSIDRSAATVVAVVRVITLLALLLSNLAPLTPAMARAIDATPTTATNQHVSPAPALLEAGIAATKTDALLVDKDGDGHADPGDTLRYTVAVSNTGSVDATGVVVNDTLDPNTSLVPGSVETTPLAFDLAATTVEDTPVDLLLTGADADGDSLTFSVLSPPAHGILSGTAPNLTYSPALDYNGADTLTFQVCDSSVPAGCDTATVSLTINGANDNPDAVDDNLTVLEDSANNPIDALANDTDAPDTGETLTILAVAPSKNSSVSILGGTSLSYTPNANFLGTDVFTYTIGDGNGGTDTAAITVTVTTINDPPVFTKGLDETVPEDAGPQTVTAWATNISPGPPDEAGQALTFNVTGNSNPGLFSAGPAVSPAGDLTYTPALNANGTATITITLQDNGGTASGGLDTSPPQIFNITVTPVNDAPVPADDAYNVNEDTILSPVAPGVLANDTDVDGDPFTAILVAAPTHASSFTLNADGSFSYMPAANYSGADSFTYKINDGTADSAPATANITVGAINDAPTASDGSVSTNEDALKTITLAGADADGDSLSFTIVSGPSHGTLGSLGVPSCAAGSCTATVDYTPAADYNGADSFTFKVNDGTTDSAPATVSITVVALNDTPTASDGSVSTNEDTLKTITLGGTDADGDSLSFTVVSGPSHGALGAIGAPSCAAGSCTATVDYTPAADYSGADSFTFKVNDGTIDSAPATVSITINSINDAPAAKDDSYSTNGAGALAIAAPGVLANDTDVESDPLTAVLVSGPSNAASFTLNSDGSFSYTANVGATSDSFTYKANDGQADSNVATVAIFINAPPVASGQSVSTGEDTLKTITLGGTDADDDNLSFTIVSGPSHGTLGAIGTADCSALNACVATVDYTPAADYNGADSFTFKVNDGTIDSAPAIVSITVATINDAPTASDGSVSTNEDTLKTITLNGADVDGGNLSFTIVSGPSHGTLGAIGAPSCAAGSCTATVDYTPAADYNGADSFTFKVNDGTVDSTPATISITVNSINDAPTANNQSVSTGEDTLKTITLGGTDADDDNLSFTIVSGPSHGTLSSIAVPDCSAVNACAATVDYTPAADYNGADSFTFKVNDGTVDSALATVSITVVAVNDAPVLANIEAIALSFTENDPALQTTANLTANDIDNANFASATVQISGNCTSSEDLLGFSNQNGISGNYNAATCVLTLTGSSSVANYQTALRSVTYANTSETPNAATRTITFKVNDGTIDSNTVSRQITITSVNDAPVNTIPAAQTVNEDTDLTFSGANAISVADIDAGSGSIQLSLTVLNGTLTPAAGSGATITGSGTSSLAIGGTLTQVNAALNGLKYKGTLNYNSTRGAETLVLVSNDNGNTGTPGPLTDTDSIGITVTPVNDAPLAQPKSYNAQTNMKIALSGLLAGASDPDTGDGGFTAVLTVTNVITTSPAGGTVTVNPATGDFNFDPPAGTTGNVTFVYTVCDNGNPLPQQCSAPATVTINVSGVVIWFVDAANGNDTNGKGTLAQPFKTIAKVDTVDAANQRIFLYAGSYATGLTLNTGEWLIGQAATNSPTNTFDALFGINPPAGTIARPAIGTGTATVQGTVTLASSAVVKGLAIVTTGATQGMAGSGGLTGVDVSQSSIASATGTALSLNNVAGTLLFTSVSANGAATGIDLTNVGASVTINGGAIQNTTATGISVSGGAANFSYAGTITSSSAAGRAVWVQNHSGGTVAFSGLINVTGGTGITLTSNTGAIINFTGGVTLSTGANSAFAATAGGTVSVTGSANTLTTTTGTALNVANTTIGASGLTFQSISSTSSSANAGIILDNTGASGRLIVTGTGGAGSGGTIANKIGGDILSFPAVSGTNGVGIFLRSTTNPSFNRMLLQNFSNFAIYGNNVNGFTFDNSTINGTNGTNNGGNQEEASIRFDTLLGSASISNDSISGGYAENILVINRSSSLNRLTMNQNAFGFISATGGNDNIHIEAFSGAVANVTFTNNTVQGTRGDNFESIAQPGSTMDVVVRSNDFQNQQAVIPGGGAGVSIRSGAGGGGNANTTFDISHNTMKGSDGVAIFVDHGDDAGTLVGTINANTIGVSGVPDSGSSGNGDGIFARDFSQGSMTVLISNNSIKQWTSSAIHLQNNDGTATMNASLFGNLASEPGATAFSGLFVDNGGTASDTSTMNLVVGSATTAAQKNDFSAGDPSDFSDISINNNFASTHLNLSRNGSAASSATQILKDDNLNGAATAVSEAGTITPVNTLPSLPPVVAPLLAAGGEGPGARSITQAELAPVAAEAIARWQASELGAAERARLAAVSFQLADLERGRLADANRTMVEIDRDAAGWGWFVDATPADDAEFAGGQTGSEHAAVAGNPARQRMDLLTAVMHELGHVLGHDDIQSADQPHALMTDALPTGARRLLETRPVLVAMSVAPTAVSTTPSSVQVDIGTMPVGKQVVITFDVLIATQLPAGVNSASNQASVSSSGLATVLTDDPATAALADPTVTTLDVVKKIYLPLITQTVAAVTAPDLVVTSVTLTPNKTSFAAGEPVQISVVVKNQGTAPATPFWIDLYLNPSRTPALNLLWNQLCSLNPCHGLAWQVDRSLAAGETLTLTSTAGSYAAPYSIWPGWFAAGTTDLYVLADSWNPGKNVGASGDTNRANNLFHIGGLSVTGKNPKTLVAQSPSLVPARPMK